MAFSRHTVGDQSPPERLCLYADSGSLTRARNLVQGSHLDVLSATHRLRSRPLGHRHTEATGVLRPSGGANAVAGCWPDSREQSSRCRFRANVTSKWRSQRYARFKSGSEPVHANHLGPANFRVARHSAGNGFGLRAHGDFSQLIEVLCEFL